MEQLFTLKFWTTTPTQILRLIIPRQKQSGNTRSQVIWNFFKLHVKTGNELL